MVLLGSVNCVWLLKLFLLDYAPAITNWRAVKDQSDEIYLISTLDNRVSNATSCVVSILPSGFCHLWGQLSVRYTAGLGPYADHEHSVCISYHWGAYIYILSCLCNALFYMHGIHIYAWCIHKRNKRLCQDHNFSIAKNGFHIYTFLKMICFLPLWFNRRKTWM